MFATPSLYHSPPLPPTSLFPFLVFLRNIPLLKATNVEFQKHFEENKQLKENQKNKEQQQQRQREKLKKQKKY